jgi:hypothetical protein
LDLDLDVLRDRSHLTVLDAINSLASAQVLQAAAAERTAEALELLHHLLGEVLTAAKATNAAAAASAAQAHVTTLLQQACTRLPAMMAVLCSDAVSPLLASKQAQHRRLALVSYSYDCYLLTVATLAGVNARNVVVFQC